jgi:hypothetical protein
MKKPKPNRRATKPAAPPRAAAGEATAKPTDTLVPEPLPKAERIDRENDLA